MSPPPPPARRSSSVDAMQALVHLLDASPNAIAEARNGDWLRALWILRSTSKDSATLERIDTEVGQLAEQPAGDSLNDLLRTIQRKALIAKTHDAATGASVSTPSP